MIGLRVLMHEATETMGPVAAVQRVRGSCADQRFGSRAGLVIVIARHGMTDRVGSKPTGDSTGVSKAIGTPSRDTCG